ncbi:Flp family type IVb pilin [Microaerobacter geothermalis]|uniref:Flp family type IVb pilin n=1 Tax=Microaerobacter geothermalis TaxID=674972 RepID=UPI001F1C25EB|nr:Flp family type IVb pilin [Microaerobacter geothermalis]MCF6094191.1 Flp family type IVb pilin [Microaerobacter geothermalis]
MMMLWNWLSWLKKDEKGQGLVEYGLIIALVGVVVAVALTAMSGGLGALFNDINTRVTP